MLKNSIVYDNNIVNICFKMKAKKISVQGGDQCHGGGGLKILGMGGDRSPWGWTTPRWGWVPPPIPPILENPDGGENRS